MMNENQVILEDLQRYLVERGVGTKLEIEINKGWVIRSPNGLHYSIVDGKIVFTSGGQPILSLADPEYREKFHEFLTGTTIPKWMKV